MPFIKYLQSVTVFCLDNTLPKGFVLNEDVRFVELTYAGQDVSVTETSTEFSNERQRVSVTLEKLMEKNEKFGITGSVTAVTFGLYASEDIEAADGTVIPKDGLIEILSVDENGHAECRTDLMFGAYYLRELTTDERYVLDGEKYPFTFEYAGQDKDVVDIDLGEIENELIQGNIRGEKSDRETGEHVTGAVFGLFMYGETVYTEKTAVMLAVSESDGRFGFEGIPYGKYFVVEFSPADGYLPNGEKYEIVVSENEAVIEIDIVNDKIPEIGTIAAADGIKSTHPTESVTIEDTVAYEHLVPGKEYILKGVLMDKGTCKPFLVDGEEVRTETTFTPDAPSGTVKVSFTFNASGITENTDIVVFESLYMGDIELTAHADIENESQTVAVLVPEIGTTATVGGEKSAIAKGDVTIDDAVSFKNLIPCKEYKLKGVLMDKATGKPFLVDGKEITSEVTFTPATAEGEVTVSFTFNASGITENIDIVVFESLYMGDIELTAHADIEDESQTVTVLVPEIGTTASADGEKSVTTKGDVTIDDAVSFKNLIPGKQYKLKGVLMDKTTCKPFLVDGKEITTELTFTPETADGEVTVSFTFNADIITLNTELVVFETLYLGDVELTAHADIEDESQTVTLTPPPPETPKTGDDSSLALWIAITGISFMGALISAAAYFKAGRNGKKK